MLFEQARYVPASSRLREPAGIMRLVRPGMSKMPAIPLPRGLASRWRTTAGQLRAVRCLARVRREIRKRPVRVAFLVIENQKWSAHSVYAALAASPQFEPILLLSTHADNVERGEGEALRTTLEQNVAFAQRHGFVFRNVFDEAQRRFIPIEDFSPDVVFYEQPYGLPPEHAPAVVSRFALTCYIPYGYGVYLAKNSGQRFLAGFSEYLWRVFLESPEFLRMTGNLSLLKNPSAVPTGYPKMDMLATSSRGRRQDEKRGGPRVIYAPHHSLTPGEGDSYGTFAWNGRWMLEFAHSTPGVRWVFKPHPKLKEQLVRTRMMTPSEVDRYFAAWDELANAQVILDGDYMPVFADADAMITDSGSFLMEFLLTGKPILLLSSPVSAGYSPFGEQLVTKLYKAADVDEIRRFVEGVVIGGSDRLRREREAVTPAISGTSGRNVASYLERMFVSEGWPTHAPLPGKFL